MNNAYLQKNINQSDVREAPDDSNTYSRQNGMWVPSSSYGINGEELKLSGVAIPVNNDIYSWTVSENTKPVSIKVDLVISRDGNPDQGGKIILEGSFWRGGGNVRSSSTRRSMENVSGSQNLRLVSSGAETVILQLRTTTSTLLYRALVIINPWEAFE